MSVDSAFQRLRDANPVPEPAALRERRIDAAVFHAATQQRSREMQTENEPITIEKRREPPRWKWMPALVTAVVLIVAGASFLLVRGGGSDVAGGGPDVSPESLLDAFIEAWDDQDVERAVGLFTEDAEFDPGTGSGSPVAQGQEEMRVLFRSAMEDFRFVEAYDLQQDGDLVRFNTRLMARGGTEEECQRNQLVVDNGKIGSWVVTVLSTSPCP